MQFLVGHCLLRKRVNNFTTVGLFVRLFLTTLLEKLWINVREISGSDATDKEQPITFSDDQHFDLEIALLCYCSLDVSTIMPTILVMSLISILCTSLILRNKTHEEVYAVMSACHSS